MNKTSLYFICNWDKYPRTWLTKKPYIKGTEIGQVAWRGKPIILHVIAEFPVTIQKQAEIPPKDLYALLKSNLQKQIRRQKISAISTAKEMWKLGQFELLRRLVVITAEDVELCAETAIICWLMVAKSKGLLLTDIHYQWVLGYVKALIEHPLCKWLEITDEYDPNLCPLTILNSTHNNKEILAGIIVRNAYGGLDCDPPMISQCIDWYLKTSTPLPYRDVKLFKGSYPPFRINPASIDYHIYNGLVDKLINEHPTYDSEFIKLVIWMCSSRINARYYRQVKPDWKTCWTVIHPDFSRITKIYLKHLINKHNLRLSF